MRGTRLFLRTHVRMPLLHLRIVAASSMSSKSSAFTPNPLRPLTSTYGLFASSARKLVSHLRRASRRQRHNFIRQMNRPLRLLPMPQRPQPLRHHLLQIRLPRINHVINQLAASPKCGAAGSLVPLVVAQTVSPSGAFGHSR